MADKKKRGRPKTKQGKSVTFYLSIDVVEKLRTMTTLSRNASALIEALINSHYLKIQREDGPDKRERLDKSSF